MRHLEPRLEPFTFSRRGQCVPHECSSVLYTFSGKENRLAASPIEDFETIHVTVFFMSPKLAESRCWLRRLQHQPSPKMTMAGSSFQA
jgi:hypothetical protein